MLFSHVIFAQHRHAADLGTLVSLTLQAVASVVLVDRVACTIQLSACQHKHMLQTVGQHKHTMQTLEKKSKGFNVPKLVAVAVAVTNVGCPSLGTP